MIAAFHDFTVMWCNREATNYLKEINGFLFLFHIPIHYSSIIAARQFFGVFLALFSGCPVKGPSSFDCIKDNWEIPHHIRVMYFSPLHSHPNTICFQQIWLSNHQYARQMKTLRIWVLILSTAQRRSKKSSPRSVQQRHGAIFNHQFSCKHWVIYLFEFLYPIPQVSFWVRPVFYRAHKLWAVSNEIQKGTSARLHFQKNAQDRIHKHHI